MSEVYKSGTTPATLPAASNAQYPSTADASSSGGNNTTANAWETLHQIQVDVTDVPYLKITHKMDYDGTNAFGSSEYAYGRIHFAPTDERTAFMSSLGTDLPKTQTGYVDVSDYTGTVTLDAQYYTDSSGGVQCSYVDVFKPLSFADVETTTPYPKRIDDFGDADITEYSGNTASATCSPASAYDDGHGVEVTQGGSRTQIYRTSGTTPGAGERFECWVQDSNSTHCGVMFAVQNSGDYYRHRISPSNNAYAIQKIKNGSGTGTSASASATMSQGSWYRLVIEWGTGGTITGRVYDTSGTELCNATITDTEWTTGGFGVYTNGSSGTAYYDEAFITGEV